MPRIRKKIRFPLPAAVAVCILLAVVFYLPLSYFLENYRKDIYDRIIDSNISALEETSGEGTEAG